MKAIISTSLAALAIGFRSTHADAHLHTSLQPQQALYIFSNNAQSRWTGFRRSTWTGSRRSTSWYKPHENLQRHALPKSIGALSEAQPTALRVPFELNDGQLRLFHTLPSGMKMEVIVQKAVKNGSNENQRGRSPIVFVHGSFHAAWCWAVHWLPFFAGAGHDCYAVSLLGQGESDIPSGSVAGSLQTHARDIAHFIKHNCSFPPILVGHSFGGLVVQFYLANVCTNFDMPTGKDEGWEEPYPTLTAAVLVCSVTPTGNSGMVWRYLLSKPVAAFKVTFSLAAKAFATSLSLCRETFFSRDMSDLQVERYQELLRNSSSVPLLDLRKLNASLPVPLPPEHAPPVLVMGASDDFIVDVQGLNETAEFYNVSPVIVEGVAHDIMLDISWEKGSGAILSWLELTR